VSSLLISVAIIVSLLGNSLTFLTNIDLDSLWTSPHRWAPRVGKFDLLTVFMGSLLVTGIAMIVAIPLGLGAAIYLAEYATPRVRRAVKPILEVLAGIPSIVLGFFAVAWIGPNIVQNLFSEADAFSIAAAGIGVGFLVTPLVASVSEDAMRAVPNALREASYGMGAKRATTVLRVVLPASISGIVAAIMLAASRAIGETMVVLLAAGAFAEADYTTDPANVGITVTAAMGSLATGTDQVAGGGGAGAGQAFNSLFFLGLLLFVVTLLLNVIGDFFVRRIRESY
jgi:phosphate transport system permease protein